MFTGTTALSLDGKGRITVPSKHRDALKAISERMMLTRHPHGCLLLLPWPVWERMLAKFGEMKVQGRQVAPLMRLMLGSAEEVGLDAAGRVPISADLRRAASLGGRVKIVGQLEHFEIWDESVFDAQMEEVSRSDSLDAQLGDLGF